MEEEKCDADEDDRRMGEDVYGGASVDYLFILYSVFIAGLQADSGHLEFYRPFSPPPSKTDGESDGW